MVTKAAINILTTLELLGFHGNRGDTLIATVSMNDIKIPWLPQS